MMPRYCILNACTQPIMFKKCLECANYAQIYWNTLNQYPHKYEWIEYSELANAKECQNNTKFNVHMQLMLTKYKSTLWNVRIMPSELYSSKSTNKKMNQMIRTFMMLKYTELNVRTIWCPEKYESNVRLMSKYTELKMCSNNNTDKMINRMLRTWCSNILNQMLEHMMPTKRLIECSERAYASIHWIQMLVGIQNHKLSRMLKNAVWVGCSTFFETCWH